MQRAVQITVRVLAGLALACALLVLGARLVLMTPPGQRFVLGQLRDALPGVEVEAAGLAGDPFSRAVLVEPRVRLCGEGRALRAHAIEARYRLLPFLAGERRVGLVVVGPSLVPDREACVAAEGAPSGRLRIDPLVIVGDDPGELRVDGSADLELVEGRPRAGDVDLEVHAVARDLPALTGDVTLEGKLRGRLDDLRLDATARVGGRPVALDGRIDALAGKADLEVRFERLVLEPPETSVSLVASGTAHVRAEGRKLTIRARGEYARRQAPDGAKLPGGGFTASASGERIGAGLELRFNVDLDEAGVAARLVGAPGLSHGSRLRGTLVVPAGGKPRLAADVVTR